MAADGSNRIPVAEQSANSQPLPHLRADACTQRRLHHGV